MTTQISPHDIRRIAVTACCDPRTVEARLKGRRQHSTVAARIDAAMRELGFTPPEAPPTPTSPEPPKVA